MGEREGDKVLRMVEILSSTVRESMSLINTEELKGLADILTTTLENLNEFFERMERNLKDFIVFERYIMCAHTSGIGYALREIPEDVKERVWELRDKPEVCGFTGEECVCGKSTEYLRERFTEKIKALADSGSLIKESSEELKRGINELGRGVEALTISARKIREIAEIIEMIALNAYIEAARLGDQGRGFKVIADEVRRASTKTNELASEIIESIMQLQEQFDRHVSRQSAFDTRMSELERDQRAFSEELNKDLMWMSQNFVDFLDYVRKFVDEDVSLLSGVRKRILSVLGSVSGVGETSSRLEGVLDTLSKMIGEFEGFLRGEIDADDALTKIETLKNQLKQV